MEDVKYYKIHYKNEEPKYLFNSKKIGDIIYGIEPDCEIYEVLPQSESGKEKEIFLGSFTSKNIFYIVTEIIGYFSKDFIEKNKTTTIEICIRLIKLWLNDNDSVSKKQFNDMKVLIFEYAVTNSSEEIHLMDACSHIMSAILGNKECIAWSLKSVSAAGYDQNFRLNSIAKMILNFVESGRNLFIV
jgi:hypothetical protein